MHNASMCAEQGSNSISLYDSRQKKGEEKRFMPPTVARDINVGAESELPARKKKKKKSSPGISLPFAIYSNIKLCLPAKTNGERRQMQIWGGDEGNRESK